MLSRSIHFCIVFVAMMYNWMHANPLLIEFPDKDFLDNVDYSEIQSKINEIDIQKIVDEYYPSESQQNYSDKANFFYRMSYCCRPVLIDEVNQLFPIEICEKIGDGGNCCVVTYASYNRIYPQLVEKALTSLKNTRFNGWFLCKIGGYPNPTGCEAKFAATPYFFKIAMILEAFKKGFDNVLWIDASRTPIKDLKPIFEYIDRYKAFFLGEGLHPEWSKYLFPRSWRSLHAAYKMDPLLVRKVGGPVIGMNRNDSRTMKFIDEFYRMARLGEPFLNQLGDVFVFSSIAKFVGFGREAFPFLNKYSRLFIPWEIVDEAQYLTAESKDGRGPFFLYNDH